MAASMNLFQSVPRMIAFSPMMLSEPKREDLGEAVPIGEPEDEGFVIEEEDRELEPPKAKEKK